MSSALFNNYTSSCLNRLINAAQNWMKKGDMDSLFRFRVSIKKIRVCLACIEMEGKTKFNDIRHRLRNYFQEGGELRELLIYQKWFQQHRLERMSKMLGIEKEIEKRSSLFKKNGDEMIMHLGSIKKDMLKEAKHVNIEEGRKYYIDLIEDKLKIPLSTPAQEHWHRKRKRIKRVLYARHWQEGKGLQLISKRQAIYLDRLQHMIGDWHDNEDMIDWLKVEFKKNDAEKHPGMLPLFKKASQLLHARAIHYKNQVKRKIRMASTVLKPLERRLEFFKK